LPTWSDAFETATNDYDIYLLNPDLTELVDYSNAVQEGTTEAIEYIDSRDRDDFGNHLVIGQAKGEARFIRLSACDVRHSG
jgi:hypothetical protein